jgi:serine/threonine-protein kinase
VDSKFDCLFGRGWAKIVPVAQDARIGAEVAGYRIESEIGRGGMSVVYLAEHLRLRRRVALKLISSELASDQTFRDRFVRESQLAASLEDPNIVPIYDAGEADGVLYIAMRYVQGTDLKKLVRAEGPLGVVRAVSIMLQTARALDAAHAEGLVHRDVKPGNILLTSSDHVYLSDFGLTKRISSDSGYTATGQFVGTLDYAAPEQFEGKPLDARTDVYSLGCVLYECLTGDPPFKADNQAALVYAHLLRPPPLPSERRPELPSGLDPVVTRAMAKAPADRYPNAGALAAAAKSGADIEAGRMAGGDLPTRRVGNDEGAAGPPSSRGARRWTRVRLLATGGIAAAAIVVATIIGINRSGPASPPSTPPARATSNTIWRLDPSTAHLVATISVGSGPGSVAIGEGSVWVANNQADTVSRIDPVTNAVATIRVGHGPEGIAVSEGSAWVLLPGAAALVRIDPSTNRPSRTIPLPDRPERIVARDGVLWITSSAGLIEVNAATSTVVKQISTVPFSPQELAVTRDFVWVASFDAVVRVDVVSGQIKGITPTLQRYCDIAATEDSVWLLGCTAPTGASGGRPGAGPAEVLRLDPSSGRADRPIPAENGGEWLSLGPNVVWILSANGSISRLDVTNSTVHPFGKAGKSPGGFAVGAGGVWVTIDAA